METFLRIKQSVRRLLNKKIITFFSITGFALSFLLLTLIVQFVVSELNTNGVHENRDRIFSVSIEGKDAWIPVALLEKIEGNPHIEQIIPYSFSWNGDLIKYEQFPAQQVEAIYVDTSFFEAFSFQFSQTNTNELLAEPFTAVITQSCAQRLFGNNNPVGKVLKHNNNNNITIVGVIHDYPKNSLFRSEIFISFESLKTLDPYTFKCGWSCSNISLFLLLKNKNQKTGVEQFLTRVIDEQELEGSPKPTLTSLKNTYLDKDFGVRGQLNKGDINRVYVFVLLGFLIFTVALFNYLNFVLSSIIDKKSGHATLKVFGSRFHHFFMSYFTDTLIVTLAALTISYMAYFLVLKQHLVNHFALFKHVEINALSIGLPVVLALVIPVVTGMLAAFWIKRTPLLQNSKNTHSQWNFGIRRAMLIGQFCVVIFLLGATLLVNKQVVFMQNKNLGFSKENLICIKSNNINSKSAKVLRSEFMAMPGVLDVCFSDAIPGKGTQGWGAMVTINGEEKQVNFAAVPAESHFVKTYGFKLKQGRFFSDSMATDISNVIINQTAAKTFGWKEPLGKILLDGWFDGKSKGKIIGIIEDCHFSSLHQKIEPLVFINRNGYTDYITLKVQGGFDQQKQVIAGMTKTWKKLYPDVPLNWFYFDDHLNSLYKVEAEFGQLTTWLSLFTLVITIFGLMGMVMFIVVQRKKEIGVRKVNGANASQIMVLLNSDFIKWLALSLIITTPLTWYAINLWLQNFAYKTVLSWWIFILAGLLTFIIAIVAVSFQTYRAAIQNPVESLKYE